MARKRRRTGILVAAGVGTAVALAAFAAGAAGPPGTRPDDGDDGYTGPDPNRPPGTRRPDTGKPEPSGPKSTRPSSIAPDDLWLSPLCDDLMLGPDWFSETATPAIEAWVTDGFGDPALGEAVTADTIRLGPGRVVREILGPYSPLCIDVFPWFDLYHLENPKPSWEPPDGANIDAWFNEYQRRLDAFRAEHGEMLIDLIDRVGTQVQDEWERQYGEGGANA